MTTFFSPVPDPTGPLPLILAEDGMPPCPIPALIGAGPIVLPEIEREPRVPPPPVIYDPVRVDTVSEYSGEKSSDC